MFLEGKRGRGRGGRGPGESVPVFHGKRGGLRTCIPCARPRDKQKEERVPFLEPLDFGPQVMRVRASREKCLERGTLFYFILNPFPPLSVTLGCVSVRRGFYVCGVAGL